MRISRNPQQVIQQPRSCCEKVLGAASFLIGIATFVNANWREFQQLSEPFKSYVGCWRSISIVQGILYSQSIRKLVRKTPSKNFKPQIKFRLTQFKISETIKGVFRIEEFNIHLSWKNLDLRKRF